MTSRTKNQSIQAALASPADFRRNLRVQSAYGPRVFGEIVQPFQEQDFAVMDRVMIALARNERPDPQRIYIERTKKASKDSDIAIQMLWLLARSPRAVDCQVCADDRDQAREVAKRCRSILRLNPWLASLLRIDKNQIINPGSESVATIITSDPSSTHGAIPDLLIVNELSHITSQEFAQNALDNAAGVPHGAVIIASNAGQLETWQHNIREMARESQRWHFSSYSQPAPWIDTAELEERRRVTPASRYNRLWHGVWSAGGDVLTSEAIERCIRHEGPMSGAPYGWRFLVGIDLGAKRDHSAVVTLGIDLMNQRLRLADCHSWNPAHYPDNRLRLDDVRNYTLKQCERFQIRDAVFDPNQGYLMSEDLQRAGINTIERAQTQKTLDEQALALIQTFENDQIEMYRDDRLIRDLLRLQLVERPNGMFKLIGTKDEFGHCDRATALTLALVTALENMPWLTNEFLHGSDQPDGELEYVDTFGIF